MLYFTKAYSNKGGIFSMKQKRMRIFLIVLAAILALFVVRTFMTPGHVPEDYVTPYYSSILSLLPRNPDRSHALLQRKSGVGR